MEEGSCCLTMGISADWQFVLNNKRGERIEEKQRVYSCKANCQESGKSQLWKFCLAAQVLAEQHLMKFF